MGDMFMLPTMRKYPWCHPHGEQLVAPEMGWCHDRGSSWCPPWWVPWMEEAHVDV